MFTNSPRKRVAKRVVKRVVHNSEPAPQTSPQPSFFSSIFSPSSSVEPQVQSREATESYAAPTQAYAASAQTYTAPTQTYTAPTQTYTAPTQTYTAPTSQATVTHRRVMSSRVTQASPAVVPSAPPEDVVRRTVEVRRVVKKTTPSRTRTVPVAASGTARVCCCLACNACKVSNTLVA
jgi:hypothetical protein